MTNLSLVSIAYSNAFSKVAMALSEPSIPNESSSNLDATISRSAALSEASRDFRAQSSDFGRSFSLPAASE